MRAQELDVTREEWGDEHAEDLRFYEAKDLKDCLDVSLDRVTQTLKLVGLSSSTCRRCASEGTTSCRSAACCWRTLPCA